MCCTTGIDPPAFSVSNGALQAPAEAWRATLQKAYKIILTNDLRSFPGVRSR